MMIHFAAVVSPLPRLIIRGDLGRFRQELELDQMVMINLASTERVLGGVLFLDELLALV